MDAAIWQENHIFFPSFDKCTGKPEPHPGFVTAEKVTISFRVSVQMLQLQSISRNEGYTELHPPLYSLTQIHLPSHGFQILPKRATGVVRHLPG